MKLSDAILFGIMIMAISLALSVYFFNNFAIGVSIGVCVCIIYVCTLLAFKKRTKYENKEIFCKTILLNGKEASNKLILALHPTAVEIAPNIFKYKNGYVVNGIKYSAFGEEDVAQIYRKALSENVENAVVFMRKIDKNALTLATSLPLTFTFFDLKKLYRLTKEKELLPKLENNKRKRIPLKEKIIGIGKIPIKYFLFASLTCALSSLVLPLKIYYLSASALNLILGIIALVINRKNQAVE